MKRYLFLLAGIISLLLGTIGIVVPLLPTTPFLLLSAYCFFKSSSRMYNWLLNHKILGTYIKNYLVYKAIPVKTKVLTILFLWITITISVLITNKLWLTFVLYTIAILVSIHILSFKTLTKKTIDNKKYRKK
jgi:uncharacterized protein